MNFEREKLIIGPRLPESVIEQKKALPGIDERKEISKAIFDGFSVLLKLNGVEIDWKLSGPRPPKTIVRIEDKIVRRNTTEPMGDIYGARFVTEDFRREWLGQLILAAYPLTPKIFPWGKPSVRDYRDAEVRANHIENSNPNMSPIYSALHINFVFRRKGGPLFDIGEIQIMTHKELEIYQKTRVDYPNGHS